MPTVPRYTSQTSPQVIEGPGFRASASPDAFGAAIGRGMQALGAGAEDLSTVFAAHAVQMQTQDNATEVDDLVTKGMLGINNLNYGDDGYYTKQKKQAVDAFEPAKAGLLKIKDDLAGQASNPAVRKAFDTAMRPQIIYNLQGMSSHYAGQRKAYQEDVFKGRVGTLEDSIGLNYANKEMFDAGLAQMRQLYTDHGVENGQPFEKITDDYMTSVHKVYGKAIGMQALHDPEGAQREADLHQEELGPDQYMAISQRLLPSLNGRNLYRPGKIGGGEGCAGFGVIP
jgi:hypothetical protein